jgi:hypothetical protein
MLAPSETAATLSSPEEFSSGVSALSSASLGGVADGLIASLKPRTPCFSVMACALALLFSGDSFIAAQRACSGSKGECAAENGILVNERSSILELWGPPRCELWLH